MLTQNFERSLFRERSSIKYAWIQSNKVSFPITTMCHVFKVNVSSYYHWIKMGCVLEKVDTILMNWLKTFLKPIDKLIDKDD